PRHENFLKSDIDGFSEYRTNLAAYTVGGMGGRGRADLAPAFKIYRRFQERMAQHEAYVQWLLKHDHFTFTGNARIQLDRRRAPWPASLSAAHGLWRQRLRYEYLQEKLGRELSPTNGAVVLPLPKNADAGITADLKRHYTWTSHMQTNLTSAAVLQTYLEALVHAYDPHSDYLDAESGQTFSIEMSLSLYGIGAQLTEQDGYCTIESLIPGGPADKSKQLQANDRIVAVAQSNRPPVNVVDVALPDVVQMIRGPKGTQVRLTVEHAGTSIQHVVTLTRERIQLKDEEAKAQLIARPDGRGGTNRIGVIYVPSFYAPIGAEGASAKNYISADVAKLLRKLEREKAQGILLDMRYNPGGSLEQAVRFTGLFIKPGPVVQALSPDGGVEVDEADNTNADVYTGPLVVMVNRLSASASEIAAGALQDYGRALLVGDTSTFGKGTVQSIIQLRPLIWPANATATNNPGEVKITIRKFYRVTGASTQLKGVVPDIILPDTLSDANDIGERALDNPLPWDTIRGRKYHQLDLVAPYLERLREESEDRTATNQSFAYVRRDVAQFKKLEADQSATLNEQQALQERERDAERKNRRDAQLARQPLPQETVYPITIENAGKPGLPAPTVETNAPAAESEGQLDDEARLREGEQILEDYIALRPKNAVRMAQKR
ncbi:MAG: carboxy terminal-processing peptidase, partial [Verrucomicrobia bacterium]|nr:carboxy terminal-processing peptidase [Verrucomicrobiota bacterium]